MEITFEWNEKRYHVALHKPVDISIHLKNGEAQQPNAYGAPYYATTPVVAGTFVGALNAGSPVNFFNVAINPHGNGTHTECVGHILEGPFTIADCISRTHYVAEVISVVPKETAEGAVITLEQIRSLVRHDTESLVLRTLPNPESKKTRKYTGTNPPWVSADAMSWIGERYTHFLTDLPSVDPEVDGGVLAGHHGFWNTQGTVRTENTITEMIYVPVSLPDGLYLLDLHNLALDLDVSPSRPVLYVMELE